MDSEKSRVLVCPHCGNQTPHKLVFEHEYEGAYYNADGTPSKGPDPPSVYMAFECATCHDISLYDGPAPAGFDCATLVYPQGDSLHESVPPSVASNFQEGKRI